jgi:MFS family permease
MQPGRWFAAAAVLVTAPRLVLAFLAADAMPLAPAVRAALLVLSSVSTAIALTGGAAYLAHTLASTGRARALLQVLWLAILVCSSALMAPVLAAGLADSPLAAVLDRPAKRWAWAICAVVAVDLVAAAVMRAEAEARREHEERDRQHERAIAELLEQRDRARRHLAESKGRVGRRSAAAAGAGGPAGGEGEGLGTASTASRVCACGRSFAKQQSLAAHSKSCPRRVVGQFRFPANSES